MDNENNQDFDRSTTEFADLPAWQRLGLIVAAVVAMFAILFARFPA